MGMTSQLPNLTKTKKEWRKLAWYSKVSTRGMHGLDESENEGTKVGQGRWSDVMCTS